MDNIDEKIAKLKMQQRLEKEEMNKVTEENSVDSKKEEITLEEVIEQMKAGFVNINNTEFRFAKKEYLKGKLQIPIPLAYFEEKANTDKNVTLINDNNGVSFTLAYVDKGAQKQSFASFKKGMEKNFKDIGLFLEWIEEGEAGEGTSKVSYGTYMTPTGKGQLYNLIFYREFKGTLMIGNYNCFEKDLKTWELLIKASIMLMKIK